MPSSNPVGVFDSGLGGLTVYRALRMFLPHEDFIYLGDTVRLPYGAKSRAEIEACTLDAARLLKQRGIKFLAVAARLAKLKPVGTRFLGWDIADKVMQIDFSVPPLEKTADTLHSRA